LSTLQYEVGKAVADLETDINSQIDGSEYYCRLPETGWTKDKIMKEIDFYMNLGKFK
jgi:hypothetical protein